MCAYDTIVLCDRGWHCFLMCSAKTRDGVQEAFQELVHKVLQTPSLYTTEERKDTLDPLAPSPAGDNWCGGSCTVT